MSTTQIERSNQTGSKWVVLEQCCVCFSDLKKAKEQFKVIDPFEVSKEEFRIILCSDCGNWILNPRPAQSEMGQYYEADFLADPNPKHQSFLSKLASAVQEFNLISEVNWARKFLKPAAKYLDYSAGNGQILRKTLELSPGVAGYATEFSSTYQDYLRNFLPAENVKSRIEDFSEKFDVISAFGVLEHVEEPRDLLKSIFAGLKDDGRALIAVPNPLSLQRALFGKDWYSWIAPRHFNLLPMAALERLCRECGYEVVEKKYFFFRTNPATFVLSIFPGLDPLKKLPSWKLLCYAALFYAFVPVEFVLAMFGQASFMGVVLKKR